MAQGQSLSGWSIKEHQVVEALAIKVRLLTLSQVARAWWATNSNPLQTARKHLRRLEEIGLVEQHEIDAEPLLDLQTPVLIWSPENKYTTVEQEIDFRGIARRLTSRWKAPSGPVTVYTATKRAANLFASYGGGIRDRLSATHDLHMGQIYIHYLRHYPEDAACWRGEDVYRNAGHGLKDPDAFLVDASGQFTKVIEFGGRYDHRRVSDFHAHCVEQNLPYELW